MIVKLEVLTLPEFKTDFSEEFRDIRGMMKGSVVRTLLDGGRPAWQKTRSGAIAQLYRYIYPALKEDSGPDFAEVVVAKPGVVRHQMGGTAIPTPKQRAFFRFMFKDTKQEMWAKMANAKKMIWPARPYMMFQDEDKDKITNKIMDAVVKIVPAKGATVG